MAFLGLSKGTFGVSGLCRGTGRLQAQDRRKLEEGQLEGARKTWLPAKVEGSL